ncbi:DNA-binding FadR family transcriptional regulator [Neorhizobium huautlense]|uniref:DNA-binding FadR family transcriptional regulator n=1 Tax=Neorhizobium huautlense TaxID=67774 RepID=A0ABT9PQ66_9HYPH|nr:FadR/GntR family transcriptional regulator [Neorhizobium huautlense]MDP9836345.1 DNA-binding FadR family transcriptional regulator [Neorhizobium huautlense]
MTADASPTMFARRESLSSQVVRVLSERIKQDEYPRGSKLPTEKALMEELGVSRTVVREAVANLRASGLVSIQHGIGVFVRDDAGVAPFRLGDADLMQAGNMIKGLELRIGIESEAAALAAERRNAADLKAMKTACDTMDEAVKNATRNTLADFEFHCAVAAASHNEHFSGIFNYLGETLMPRMRRTTHAVDDETLSNLLARVNNEHRAILVAIEARDADGARTAMRAHLIASKDRTLAKMRQD